MGRVDDSLAVLAGVASGSLTELKAARAEIKRLLETDATEDAAQLEAALNSVADKIDSVVASLTENPDVPVEPETPEDPETPVEPSE